MAYPTTRIPAERFQDFTNRATATDFMIVLIELYGRTIAEDVAFEVNEKINGRTQYPPVTWPTF